MNYDNLLRTNENKGKKEKKYDLKLKLYTEDGQLFQDIGALVV